MFPLPRSITMKYQTYIIINIENMLGSMFSQMCKIYNKFCNPSAEERIKGKRMSDDLFIKNKKDDDYFLKHHEGILQLVEIYE
jgi:hypothetical protein